MQCLKEWDHLMAIDNRHVHRGAMRKREVSVFKQLLKAPYSVRYKNLIVVKHVCVKHVQPNRILTNINLCSKLGC